MAKKMLPGDTPIIKTADDVDLVKNRPNTLRMLKYHSNKEVVDRAEHHLKRLNKKGFGKIK